MTIDSTILRRLSAVEMSPEAFREILSIIADIQKSDEDRKAKQRERTLRSRHGNVTVTAKERYGNCDKVAPTLDKEIPPTPPKENSTLPPTKTAKRASALPPDWKPDNRDIAFASKRGGSSADISIEGERFAAHHWAKGSLMKDWHMAWQTWWLSPIRNRGTGPPNGAAYRNGHSPDQTVLTLADVPDYHAVQAEKRRLGIIDPD